MRHSARDTRDKPGTSGAQRRIEARGPGWLEREVAAVVRRIPPGQVMSYGDVAEYLGGTGPRQVGAAMSRLDSVGEQLPWWRVIYSDGSPPPGMLVECQALWRAEGTPLRPDGTRVDMRRARWDGRSR